MDNLEWVRNRLAELRPEVDRLAGLPGKLSGPQQARWNDITEEVALLEERADELAEWEKRAKAAASAYPDPDRKRGGTSGNPLAFTRQGLDRLQHSLDGRTSVRIDHDTLEERATLQTGTYGATRDWGSNVLQGPRILHVAAGVPVQRVDAALAAHPVLTLPTSTTGVAETVTVIEYAASTAGSVTLTRFGRWTDFSRESSLGTDAGALVAMHATGVALDLDATLIALINTAAGGAVGFITDVPANIRRAQAKVIAATAAPSAADVVIMCHPDNADLLEAVVPISGSTIAEGFQKFSGSLVYPSLAVPTSFMLLGNLKAGARYFEAQGFQTETDVLIKTAVQTVASSTIGGYGITLAGTGSWVKVDVITP